MTCSYARIDQYTSEEGSLALRRYLAFRRYRQNSMARQMSQGTHAGGPHDVCGCRVGICAYVGRARVAGAGEAAGVGGKAVACVQGLVALFATWELRSCERLKKLLCSIVNMIVS